MLTITTSFSDESATSTQSSDDSSMSTEPTEVSYLWQESGNQTAVVLDFKANSKLTDLVVALTRAQIC